jgi:hypothetical protein
VVNATGTLARGNSVDAVTRPATGSYLVDFNQNINNCAFVSTATSTTATAAGPPSEGTGFAEAAISNTGNDKVRVFTFDKGGSIANRAFHLAVMC